MTSRRARTFPLRAFLLVADAGGALAFKKNALRLNAGENLEIAAAHRRVEIGRSGRAALAILRAAMELCHLVETDAFLFGAVEIVVATDLAFLCRADEIVRE